MAAYVWREAHPDWQVPAFDELELKPRAARHCVCVFVINEGERIRRQLRKMRELAGLADIVVADGGSTDGSLAEDFLREQGVRTLLTKTGPGRLSAQMRMALAWALDQGYEGVVVVDGNDKDDTTALPLFLEALDQGCDHVQGSRYIPGGKAINTPLERHLAVQFIHAPLISLAAGTRYTDTTNGFRAYSRRMLLDPRVKPFRDVFMAYELHYYLAIRSARLGMRLKEVPVTRAYPDSGEVPSKIGNFSGKMKLMGMLLKACTGAYNP